MGLTGESHSNQYEHKSLCQCILQHCCLPSQSEPHGDLSVLFIKHIWAGVRLLLKISNGNKKGKKKNQITLKWGGFSDDLINQEWAKLKRINAFAIKFLDVPWKTNENATVLGKKTQEKNLNESHDIVYLKHRLFIIVFWWNILLLFCTKLQWKSGYC